MKFRGGKIVELLHSIRHYLIFNFLSCLFLLVYLLVEYQWNSLYSFVFFLADAPYQNFKLWYPHFYFGAYLAVLTVKVIFFAALIFTAFYFLKKSRNIRLPLYNKQTGYLRFMRFEAGIALLFLLFYIALYFSSKNTFESVLNSRLQVMIARGFLLHLLFQFVTILANNFKRISDYVKRYLFSPQLPYNIAILRILFFLYLVFIYSSKYNSKLPTVSLTTKTGLPYINWLVDILPVNPSIYSAFVFAGIICCLFIVVGFKTRLFLLLNAICCFYIIATPNFFGKIWHNQLVIWICWFFVFSRCYDVFSLDARLKGHDIVRSPDYTFPVRFVWLQLGIIYFWAGFYKLWDCGFDWALSSSMVNQVQLEWLQNYDKIPAIRIDKYPLMLYLGGLAVILFELSYIMFVIKSSARWIAAAGGLMMHNIINYFMYINFFIHLQVFYVFFIDFNWFFKKKEYKTVSYYSKAALTTGIIILSTNFLCGMLCINTYPFSAYPKYSAIIPDTVKIIQFEAFLPDGTLINVHETGKKNRFRWEDYGWLEHNLVKDFEEGIDISDRLKAYWQIWKVYNPELAKCSYVNVSVVQRPVAPEGKNDKKVISFMGRIE